ncbi:hypothetical protein BWI17_01850 [Betaproteobacteria bacterium GR16-43]|nr:hypothetical protein BWI17_01850 [Betaproteobacteria bacterium GR16-43]
MVAEFTAHATKWKMETALSSSLTKAAMHNSYQRIIGLGPEVIPLVLRDLKETGDAWFWALHALTGEDPVPAAHRGDFEKMTGDWLAWGLKHGHL